MRAPVGRIRFGRGRAADSRHNRDWWNVRRDLPGRISYPRDVLCRRADGASSINAIARDQSATRGGRRMTRPITSAAMLVGLVLAGCKVGPNYKRPEVDAPAEFRGATT